MLLASLLISANRCIGRIFTGSGYPSKGRWSMMRAPLAFVAHFGRKPAMDGPEFDAWTRRRVGLAAGGSLAALVGLAATDARKKKRCKKLGARCKRHGKRQCCGKLRCDFHSGNAGIQTFCCKPEGASCEQVTDCCAPFQCNLVTNTCVEQLPPSDRAIKSNFGSVDPADMLERVKDLPISTWNYTSDDPSIRHIGPMAQDFAALFGVGADDRHIHPLDGQGVALAAIQGLLAELEQTREDNALLAARVAALERQSDGNA
jgi:hypothetical protein